MPLIGFSELVNRLKHQEHEAEQHKNRIDVSLDLIFLSGIFNKILRMKCVQLMISGIEICFLL